MTAIFVAVRKSAKSDYEIEVPDLPGCTAVTKISDEVDKKAREAIDKHLIKLVESGTDFIFVSAFRELVNLAEYINVTWYGLIDINTHGLCIKTEMH